MPLNNLLDNEFEFMLQTHQQISEIENMRYWKFEAFIERLNRRNDELAAASNAHLADPNDKTKQKELAVACQNMKDAVDEVLGRVRPHATLTDPNSVKVSVVTKQIEAHTHERNIIIYVV